MVIVLCCCSSNNFVRGLPNLDTVQDAESIDTADGDGYREADTHLVRNKRQCAKTAGCYKGYCWAYCIGTGIEGEWCYTTRSYSQSFEYVKCEHDWECGHCMACAGSCTV